MAEIHASVRTGPAEPAFPLLLLSELMPTLRERRQVIASPLLIGRTAYERLWAIINRVLRRASSSAVAPVVAQQNEWNAAAEDTLMELAAEAADLQAEISRLYAEQHAR